MLKRAPLEEQPTRVDPLSLDQLCHHAQCVARRHVLGSPAGSHRLLGRLEENARVLEETRRLLGRMAADAGDLPPAAVWLLDNYYLIHDQVRMARHHLSRKCSRDLPSLSAGTSAGLPRVYDLALELTSHADGQWDPENLGRSIGAYQDISPLRIGELWAVPLMLQVALIENLRHIAVRTARQQWDQQRAATWAERVLRAWRGSPRHFEQAVSELAAEEPSPTGALVARFVQRLRGSLPEDNAATRWLAERLGQRGQSIDALVDLDSRNQAADQLSISNSIGSLRALASLDWKAFVEEQSAMERILRQDPAGVYAAMSFDSRDYYRHVVEKLARRSPLTEEQVAGTAIEHAQSALNGEGGQAAGEASARRRHVGYYLVGRGRRLLEESIGYRPTWKDALAQWGSRAPLACYLGATLAVWLLTVGTAACLGWHLGIGQVAGPGTWLILLLTFAGAAGQLAVGVVNWLATMLVPPRPVMRFDFSQGIPAEHRTLVAVPTLLTSEQGVRSLVEQLEIRYLANQDDQLLFALVTDFPDADQEQLPGDEHLLALARSGIERLNHRYRADGPAAFYLFHRPRRWNSQEGAWMGHERKRGKLAALNRLLRSGTSDEFSVIVGDPAGLASVRHVITLDTDTQLPRDAARELVGSMAHPLNRPEIAPETGVVVEGHGILQPRVATTIPEAHRSRFSRLFACDPGIDPYTRQTSDVYQDVFGEGSFIGKGIYDVDAFQAVLDARFPDNRVLSHDLIEGCFARSGFVNDVQLFEGYPSRLLADMSRRHRWMRGDWQIAAWLGRRVPAAQGHTANPLSWLSRWKIFDNLRRSLTPIFLLVFLFLGWTLAPALAGYWLLLALLVAFGPAAVSVLPGFWRKPDLKPWLLHLKDQARQTRDGLTGEAVHWCILPYTVHCHLDAIARTLYRLRVSQTRLLEWTTASDAEVRSEGKLRDHYEIMWAPTVAGLGVAAALAIVRPSALMFAGPAILAWLAGPAISWWISQPRRSKAVELDQAEARQVRRWARQTWHYFETFVNGQENWLPPDNVQEHPRVTIAPRTSPTNIGMGLMAGLAAHDLGYLPAARLLERTGRTLRTIAGLERYRGHFYNWYHTRTLEAMEPRYVSTVDSGNLWAALEVLRAGLNELGDRPLVAPRLFEGLQDTIEVIAAWKEGGRAAPFGDGFRARLADLREACSAGPPGEVRITLERLARIRDMAEDLRASCPTEPFQDSSRPLAGEADLALVAVGRWADALVEQCAAAYEELGELAFWAHGEKGDSRLLPERPEGCFAQSGSIPFSPRGGPGGPFPADENETRALEPLRAWIDRLDRRATLRQLTHVGEEAADRIRPVLEAISKRNGSADESCRELRRRLARLRQAAERAAAVARRQLREIDGLETLCREISAMDFRFLYDPSRKLLAIGYNVSERRRDPGYYDLLASESRLTSFLAISHGQLPCDHWFGLGRMVTMVDGEAALVSWSGSMFEYLMPMLFMPSHPGTQLERSCRAAVRAQVHYARRRGVPWGISESCYHLTNAGNAYCYRAFGVPGLGLDRGLGDNLVMAPYASAMAVMVAPREACRNLDRLERLGCLSPFGFYDAIDCTAQRGLSADRPALCRTVMAHHNGMALVAFANVIADRPMPRRLLKNPRCRAHDLLLQERVPGAVCPIDPQTLDTGPAVPRSRSGAVRAFDTSRAEALEVHLLGNGNYHVVLTSAGGGRSRWKDLAVTRWRENAPHDPSGQICYLRDLESGAYWSTTYQPARRAMDRYQAVFSQGRGEYRVVCEEIDARTQVCVSPEDDLEVRRVTLTNLSRKERTIELTSYAELDLAAAHKDRGDASGRPVEAEWLSEWETLLFRRPPGGAQERGLWVFHLMHVQPQSTTPAGYEISRERFTGQEGDLQCPAALKDRAPLSCVPGAVPDPVASVRRTMTLASEESAVVHIVTGVAESRERAMAVIGRSRDPRLAARLFELSAARSELALQHLGITEADAQLYARLASALLYTKLRHPIGPAPPRRRMADLHVLKRLGISGERPLVVVRCSGQKPGVLIKPMIHAHAYWRGKGLEAELIFWLDPPPGRHPGLYQQVVDQIAASPLASCLGRPGGVLVWRGDQQETDVLRWIQAAARIYLDDAAGTLEEQVRDRDAATEPTEASEPLRPACKGNLLRDTSQPAAEADLLAVYDNAMRDRREYVSESP